MYEYQGNLYSIGELYNQYGISIECKARRRKINNCYEFEIHSLNSTESFEISSNYEETTNISEWIPDIYKKGKTVDRQNFEDALKKAKLVNAWTNVSSSTNPVLRNHLHRMI